MATATKKTVKKEPAAAAEERLKGSVNEYIDRLIEGNDRLAETVGSLRDRNARVADKVIAAVIDNQREALEFGKTVMASPTAYARNMEALMDSVTHAQERALDVAKTVYREQAEATAAARTMFEPLVDATGKFARPFEKITEAWSQAAR